MARVTRPLRVGRQVKQGPPPPGQYSRCLVLRLHSVRVGMASIISNLSALI